MLFDNEDFVFTFDEVDGEPTSGGALRPSLISTNLFLGTLPGDGNGQNLVTLEACGVNQPHVHPRGTETSSITNGVASGPRFMLPPGLEACLSSVD